MQKRMIIEKTEIEDLLVLNPNVYGDERGCFFEIHNQGKFEKLNMNYNFVQDNISVSEYGVIRGLHYQINEFSQAKLVQVLMGKVLDVVVDLRKDSATYGKKFSVVLSDENKKQMIIPRGFAHGFSVLSEKAMFYYKCDNYYNKDAEAGIKVNDASLKIDWMIPEESQIVNVRDKNFPEFGKQKEI